VARYVKGTRVTHEDVGRYRKKDTGTMGPVHKKSDKMKKGQTRVSQSMGHTSNNGVAKSSLIKGTRVGSGSSGGKSI
jgi:hypothetical protein